VLRMYAENPTFSVQRYRLTKKVPGLRAYELSVVWRYERALAEYLRARFAGRRDGSLQADVIAAAVVAAHNNALRSWLRSDGQGDASATVDHALGYVRSAFGAAPAPLVAEQPEDVVVVVSRRGAPLWRVVQEIETALGRD
jgi:MftR C-terminal domain